MTTIGNIESTLRDLLQINAVYPECRRIIRHLRSQLYRAGTRLQADIDDNIVATIPGVNAELDAIALVSHLDVAEPIGGREILTDELDRIHTDGHYALGGDDRTAVACMIELANFFSSPANRPARTIQLVFTIGKESDSIGAAKLDLRIATARQAVVIDLDGPVNTIAATAPGRFGVEIDFAGNPAETDVAPAYFMMGHLLNSAPRPSGLIASFGVGTIGTNTRLVSDHASLRGEVRSQAAAQVAAFRATFEETVELVRTTHTDVTIDASYGRDEPPYVLNQTGPLYQHFVNTLAGANLTPNHRDNVGLTDANTLAARGFEVITIGAAYSGSSHDEVVDLKQLQELYEVMQSFCMT